MKRLPAIVDTIGEIGGSLRSFYDKGDDGRWHLQVQEVDGISLGEVGAHKAEADRVFCALDKKIRLDAIDAAIIAAGGEPDLLRPHVERSVRVDRKTLGLRIVDKDGKRAFTTKGTLATITDVVTDLKGREDFARAFEIASPSAATQDGGRFGGHPTLSDQCRAMKAAEASSEPQAPRPQTLDPRASGYSVDAAMRWAKGHPDRIAEVQKGMAGR